MLNVESTCLLRLFSTEISTIGGRRHPAKNSQLNENGGLEGLSLLKYLQEMYCVILVATFKNSRPTAGSLVNPSLSKLNYWLNNACHWTSPVISQSPPQDGITK